ncbi:hypothetical protein F0562_032961 [Nyssa sinensis]|uniref:Uncharacterized protein n=1 Tax=Nyssa sinensis TaxID=561372 RepID=A0A5J5AT68_9ASTE|nr:hypothetical protein F0562_032961 [Nyssa sinensis]
MAFTKAFGNLKLVLLNGDKLPAKQEALKEAVVEIVNCRKGDPAYPLFKTVAIEQDCCFCTLIIEKFALTSREILAGRGFSRLLLAGILLDTGKLTNWCFGLPCRGYVSHELGIDMDLYALVFGESVLNYAMAISLYRTMSLEKIHASSGQNFFMKNGNIFFHTTIQKTATAVALLKEVQLTPLPSMAAPPSLVHQTTGQGTSSTQIQWPSKGSPACFTNLKAEAVLLILQCTRHLKSLDELVKTFTEIPLSSNLLEGQIPMTAAKRSSLSFPKLVSLDLGANELNSSFEGACKLENDSIHKPAEHIRTHYMSTESLDPEKGLTVILQKLKTLSAALSDLD